MDRMKTKIINIDENDNINLIKDTILKGDLVAFPTETVYGLGADGLNVQAVKKIFEVKGRPQNNPIILHVCDYDMVKTLTVEDMEKIKKVGDVFWPGPLTLVVKRSTLVPDIITGGLDTVAIRMPSNKIALDIIKSTNRPIAAPSANISGRPSPTDAITCFEDLNGKIEYIVEGGKTEIGLESTVLDISEEIPSVLRPGKVTLEDLQPILPNVEIDKGIIEKGKTPKSPGQLYKHYSPKADSYLVKGDFLEKERKIKDFILNHPDKKISLMVTSDLKDRLKEENYEIFDLGCREDLDRIGSLLFRGLRNLDKIGSDIILIEEFKEEGLGLAIMNRLKKTTSNKHI